MKTLEKETQRHSTAFAYYLQLGGERSYAKVADKFGFSETSVRKWAQSFDWEQRVLEADTKANTEQRERATETYVQTVEDYRSLKYRTFAMLKARVDSGNCSIMELIHVLRAVKVELGEPIHITAVPQQSECKNPFSDIIDKVFGENGVYSTKRDSTQTPNSRS